MTIDMTTVGAFVRLAGVSSVSGFIRGKAGTPVVITLRKLNGRLVTHRILRKAVPGGSAEILGSLFGSSSSATYKQATLQGENALDATRLQLLASIHAADKFTGATPAVALTGVGAGPPEKLEKLERLYRRGNLTEEEYSDARFRLEHGEVREKKISPTVSFSDVLTTLGQDLNNLISDPEVIRRKKMLADKNKSGSFSGPSTPALSAKSHSPVQAIWSQDHAASPQHQGPSHRPSQLEQHDLSWGEAQARTSQAAVVAGRTRSLTFEILGEVDGRDKASEAQQVSAWMMDGTEYDGTQWQEAGQDRHVRRPSPSEDLGPRVAEVRATKKHSDIWDQDEQLRLAQLAATEAVAEPATQRGFLGLFGL